MEWLKKLLSGPGSAEEPIPAYWQQYEEAVKQQEPSFMPLSQATFVVFDTETTGLEQRTDRVLSIGAVRIQALQVVVSDSFECLIKQEGVQLHGGAEVHGILSAQLQEGLTEQQALQDFLAYIGSAILVGHHVAFDVAMINQMLRRQGIRGKLRNRTVDTAQLAIRLERRHADSNTLNNAEYRLDALCARYNLPCDDRHTASGDAFTTALLLLKLIALAKHRGIITVGDLVR